MNEPRLGLENVIQLDEVGEWSQIKHDILKRYATEYSRILANQGNLTHYYIDAFAGAGICVSKSDGQQLLGSPMHALEIAPPFKHYFFIDLDQSKAACLEGLVGKRADVSVIKDDCNVALLERVFPMVQREDYRRALCVLDPYGLHLDWNVVREAGKLGTIEIFVNFSIFDVNRNVVRDYAQDISRTNAERMNRFWGDESWRDLLYAPERDLFGEEQDRRFTKANIALVQAYRERLMRDAGFKYVPEPIPFKNEQGGVLYFLYFASHNNTGQKIVKYIFDKYRKQGGFKSPTSPA